MVDQKPIKTLHKLLYFIFKVEKKQVESSEK